MTKDETRKILFDEIDNFRLKAKHRESLRLFETAKYAGDLDLALATMLSDNVQDIS